MPVGKPECHAVALETACPGAQRVEKGHEVCLMPGQRMLANCVSLVRDGHHAW